MEPSIETLRENYKEFSDEKLIKFSKNIEGFRPEAIAILKEEIKKRGLPDEIIYHVEAQLEPIDIIGIAEYCNVIQQLPCPQCNSSEQKLNAVTEMQVMSFLIFTNYHKKLKIACPSCLNKGLDQASLTSALIGWWGFPWGFIRTPEALIHNSKMAKLIKEEKPTDILRELVTKNVGIIEVNKNNPEQLKQLITIK